MGNPKSQPTVMESQTYKRAKITNAENQYGRIMLVDPKTPCHDVKAQVPPDPSSGDSIFSPTDY